MWLSIPMIHNLLILICAFIILARETKYKILILRVDEIMLALFLAALESNEDKQVFRRKLYLIFDYPFISSYMPV